MRRIPDELKDMLNESGVDWRLEIGTRHMKVMIGGRLAAILPKGKAVNQIGYSNRSHKNMLAQVRRAITAQGRHS